VASSLDQFANAFDALKRAHEAGRLAHAYLVVAPPRGAGTAFARALLMYLFCAAERKPCGQCRNCERIERKQHPDVSWLEPEKKSRIISVQQVRDLTQGLMQTAYEGGWKGGVLLFADRMNEEAANAFLKTLEEPPGRTLLLLVTDHPQGLLPTIRSRCQRIVLAETDEEVPAWRGDMLDLLRGSAGAGATDALVLGARMRGMLARLKDELKKAESDAAGDEDVDDDVLDARTQAKLLKERTDMLRLMLSWYRDVLACTLGAGADVFELPDEAKSIRAAASASSPQAARRALESVERMARQFERNLPEASVLGSGFLSVADR